jgi:hypothetical protein
LVVLTESREVDDATRRPAGVDDDEREAAIW